MKLYILSILTFIFSINQLSAQSNSEQITAIICGKLIDGKSDKARNDAVILVAGERIIEVGNKELISPDYQLIDLSDYTVLPGMIDAHTHPLIYGDDYQTNHHKKL